MSNTILKYNNRQVSILWIGFILLVLASCSKRVVYDAPIAISKNQVAVLSKEKQVAYQFLTTAKSDKETLDTLLSDSFNSFDDHWKGGKVDFIEKRNSDVSFSQIEPVRILQDDSLVAVHSRMLGDTLRFRWDILKMEQLKIREHWSKRKRFPRAKPQWPHRNRWTNGSQSIGKNGCQPCTNRPFYGSSNDSGRWGARKFFNFGLCVQHNRDVGDGLIGLLWGMLKISLKGDKIKFEHNYHVIAEGNLVLSATEGYLAGEKFTYYDLFRIEKIK